MFSNLASYIFGASETTEEVSPVVEETTNEKVTPDEEGWVVVGDAPQNFTLGSMSEVPRPALSSTGSSEASTDDDALEAVNQGELGESGSQRPVEGALTRSDRRLTVPFGSLPAGAASLSEIQAVRSAQARTVKDSSKHLSAKALDRRNKAVKFPHGGSSRKGKAPTMALRASGSTRHLKQC